MNRNNFWKFVFVVLVVAWSLYEMYPPNAKDLVQHFAQRARARDEAFNGILARAQELEKSQPDRGFANLQEAIGTNDVARYFPFFDVKNELNPTFAVLSRLQREAAGKIKLGLDLQGGTSFLVEMDTNALVTVETVTNSLNRDGDEQHGSDCKALSQAVEVLRKRVDKFGVAEPVIQPAGNNRILIQLPGLSEADKESAKKQIQKAAFLEFRMVHEQSDELVKNGEIPPGYELFKRKKRTRRPGTIEAGDCEEESGERIERQHHQERDGHPRQPGRAGN